MPEGLSASEVGKEIAEHREHVEHAEHEPAAGEHSKRDRWVSIVEAVMLSLVALVAAWSGYSAAKWSTHASLSLAKAATTRNKANLASVQALQIRTLDSVSFNAVATAYEAHDARAFALTVKRLRPGYRPAFNAWLATHPLKNPHAPPDPSYLPQYRIPQEAQAKVLNAQADALFTEGEERGGDRGQVRAPHGPAGRGAVPGRDRQPVPAPRGALRIERGGLRPAGRVGHPAARSSRPAAVTPATGRPSSR